MGNELYDLTEPVTRALYEEVKGYQSAEVFSRDTTSFDEIFRGVNNAAAKHAGDGLIVLAGAYPHIIGAVVRLTNKFNVEYQPMEGLQISTRTIDTDRKPTQHLEGDFSANLTAEDLRVQIERAIGVTKYLGFEDMEETLFRDRSTASDCTEA
jgi:hypothetical protein